MWHNHATRWFANIQFLITKASILNIPIGLSLKFLIIGH